MILNQPYITNTPELSSSSLELKCLFLALCIIFLVNTPMSYIKSGREEAFAKQLIELEHTYLIHDKILRLLSSISKTDIAQSYHKNPIPFNELRKSFLASQDLIRNISIQLVDKPTAKMATMLMKATSPYHQWDPNYPTQNYPIYHDDHPIGYLSITLDLSKFASYQAPNTLVLDDKSNAVMSTFAPITLGKPFVSLYSRAWFDLQATQRPTGLLEYETLSISYRKVQLPENRTLFLLRVIDNRELVPSYFYLILFLGSALVAISVYVYRMRKSREKLTQMTYCDALSGLYNRHYLTKIVEQISTQQHYWVCMFDIDHFKRINDAYGHDIGDKVIKHVSHMMKSRVRNSDYAFRIGGEEFVVILNVESLGDALSIVQRIRSDVEYYTTGPQVTISGGLCYFDGAWQECIKLADTLLYQAKQKGRNQICYPPLPLNQAS